MRTDSNSHNIFFVGADPLRESIARSGQQNSLHHDRARPVYEAEKRECFFHWKTLVLPAIKGWSAETLNYTASLIAVFIGLTLRHLLRHLAIWLWCLIININAKTYLTLLEVRRKLENKEMPPPGLGSISGTSSGTSSGKRKSSGTKSHSRSYPRGVGLDFRKLAGLTLASYIDHHGEYSFSWCGVY